MPKFHLLVNKIDNVVHGVSVTPDNFKTSDEFLAVEADFMPPWTGSKGEPVAKGGGELHYNPATGFVRPTTDAEKAAYEANMQEAYRRERIRGSKEKLADLTDERNIPMRAMVRLIVQLENRIKDQFPAYTPRTPQDVRRDLRNIILANQ